MCFSATGSFAAAAILTGIGAASTASNSSSRYRMFAAVPLLFAAQQATEGVVWLTMGDASQALVHRFAVTAYLAFALIAWPMWLTFSLELIERNPVRQRILKGLFCWGGAVAIYAAVLLERWHPIAQISGRCIRYDYQTPGGSLVPYVYLVAYVVPTIVPFFVSTATWARNFGAMFMASLALAIVVQRNALTSVWCFFAALLSSLVLIAVKREQSVQDRDMSAHRASLQAEVR